MDVKERSKYEGKIATLTAINGGLQQEIDALHDQLEGAQEGTANEELQELQEEFRRRLATADRAIATLKDKNEKLKQQLQAASVGGQGSEARLAEKDAQIQALQEEGDRLSRHSAECEANLKRLRASLRDADAERDRSTGRVAGLEAQVAQQADRHAAAIQASHEQVQQMELDMENQRSIMLGEVATMREDLQAAQAELQQRANSAMAQARTAASDREAALTASLEDQRTEFQAAEERWQRHEAQLRGEVALLEDSVRRLEGANADLQAASSDHLQPLQRQIASLSAALRQQQQGSLHAEHELTSKLREAMSTLHAAQAAESSAKAARASVEAGLQAAQHAAASNAAKLAQVQQQGSTQQRQISSLQREVASANDRLTQQADQHRQDQESQEVQIAQLQEQLWDAGQEVRALKAKLQQQAAAPRHPPASQLQPALHAPAKPGNIQTPGPSEAGAMSPGAEGTSGQSPRVDSPLPVSFASAGVGESPRRRPGLGDVKSAAEAAALDDYDALFRHLDRQQSSGRPQHRPPASIQTEALQQRCREAEAEADAARAEAMRAAEQYEEARTGLADHEALKLRHAELEERGDLLCELLGERNETIDELHMDIADMKHIFHEQLEALMQRCNVLEAAQRSQYEVAARADGKDES